MLLRRKSHAFFLISPNPANVDFKKTPQSKHLLPHWLHVEDWLFPIIFIIHYFEYVKLVHLMNKITLLSCTWSSDLFQWSAKLHTKVLEIDGLWEKRWIHSTHSESTGSHGYASPQPSWNPNFTSILPQPAYTHPLYIERCKSLHSTSPKAPVW